MGKSQKIELLNPSPNSITLPDHLIIDHILPRLPVKTLIRFKSVSKLWLSSTSTPEFAKSHLNFCSHDQILLLTGDPQSPKSLKFLLLFYDKLNNLKNPLKLDTNLRVKQKQYNLEIVGSSCNGLVCFINEIIVDIDKIDVHENGKIKIASYFSICNPATHQCCDIPNPDSKCGWSSRYWFGYIPSVDDHMIVARFYSNQEPKHRHYYVYSLRIREWKIINHLDMISGSPYEYLSQMTSVVDNVLYWSPLYPNDEQIPVTCRLKNEKMSKRFIGYDLVNEEVIEFPWMDWLNAYVGASFSVMNGCLSLFCCSYDQVYDVWMYDVWMLKERDDWSSWEKSFSVRLGDMSTVFSVIPNGKLLLGNHEDSCQFYKLQILGLSKDGQEQSYGDVYLSDEYITCARGYVESLASPFGTIKSTEEEHHDS